VCNSLSVNESLSEQEEEEQIEINSKKSCDVSFDPSETKSLNNTQV
jgi:hypothetical protein